MGRKGPVPVEAWAWVWLCRRWEGVRRRRVTCWMRALQIVRFSYSLVARLWNAPRRPRRYEREEEEEEEEVLLTAYNK